MGSAGPHRLQSALAPVGLGLFSVLTVLLAFLALNPALLASAGLWPSAYFLAISAQWGALGVACVGLCARDAQPLLRGHTRWQGKGPALVALLLFHALMALAGVAMGFADALVGGQRLPGYVVELLPREGQLLVTLAATWALMVLGASFLWVYSRVTPWAPRRHAPVVAATLLVGAVAYWGWGWSRFYPTFAGEWFSLWKVGALDIAVEGTIFQTLLVAMPLVHACIVAALVVQLVRAPLAAAVAAAHAEPQPKAP
jgi:hypothetical protein